MADNVLYINPDWIESAKRDLSDEDMREYYYWLVECRVLGRSLDECNDKLIKIALRDILRQSDDIKISYENQKKEGQKGGRKPNPKTEEIYKMAKEGRSGAEIAMALSMNVKTVYSNTGWKDAQAELKAPQKSQTAFSF